MAARCFFLWLNQTSPRSSFLLLLFIFAMRCVVDSGLKNTTLSFYSTDWQYLAHRNSKEINAGVTLNLKSSHASKYRFMSVWPCRMLAADWCSRRRGGQRPAPERTLGLLDCSAELKMCSQIFAWHAVLWGWAVCVDVKEERKHYLAEIHTDHPWLVCACVCVCD